jgi:hypothetical protein
VLGVPNSFMGIRFDWRTGSKIAFGICLFAFLVNASILVAGIILHKGYKQGIGILNRGDSGEIAHLSTLYHILINVLSTGLLTSSNFCMQLLCAPTREEIDHAHAKGTYLEIGILSFRNLRRISRRRAVLCYVLVASSLPLHLL